MTTITATKARSDWFQLLKQTALGGEPQRISSKEGGVVLMSEDYYESLIETMELLSIPGFKESLKESLKEAEEDIRQGRTYSMEEVFKDEVYKKTED